MPTNAWRRPAGLLPLATLVALSVEQPRALPPLIASWSTEAIGVELNGYTTSSYASGSISPGFGSVAIGLPMSISYPFLVRKVFWFNGTTATTDSVDVGVYTEAGALVVSGGGTAVSGASSIQEVDVTDTLLKPGRYWLVYVQNGTTFTPVRVSIAQGLVSRSLGIAQMAAAYPLPSTFTPATSSVVSVPLAGIASRTLAA